MNFKKRFLTLCVFLTLSSIVPQQPIVSTPNTIQTFKVVQARKESNQEG